MRTFTKKKALAEILSDARLEEWDVDTEAYDKGDDAIWFTDKGYRRLQVRLNVVSRRFLVYRTEDGKFLANEENRELDNTPWYKEILELFFEEGRSRPECDCGTALVFITERTTKTTYTLAPDGRFGKVIHKEANMNPKDYLYCDHCNKRFVALGSGSVAPLVRGEQITT